MRLADVSALAALLEDRGRITLSYDGTAWCATWINADGQEKWTGDHTLEGLCAKLHDRTPKLAVAE